MSAIPRRQLKQLAQTILSHKGIDYGEWLDAQHQKVLAENVELVSEALGQTTKSYPKGENTDERI